MWIDVAEAELPEGARRLIHREGHEIALFCIQRVMYAIEDSCPHAGGSLVLGALDGTIVTCRVHGLRFDVRTGCHAGSTGLRARSYPLRVRDGRVEIDIGPSA
jgi:3-phenylpropionate/trans-cinnamate dioxygenase ferredoxin subunit